MNKRYQVFVSSTYTDLFEERNEVMQALLELDCMPAGMELFPASNETQWSWIKKVIDESDYYVVIIAGRYGSISEDKKISYTEMEYRYAIEMEKPIIAFVHEDISKLPSGLCEEDAKKRKMLVDFQKLVKKKLCKFYNSPTDLGAKVSRSITQLKKQFPATGWVRADVLNSIASSEEILKLRDENSKLKELINEVLNKPPENTQHLASGKEKLEVAFYYKFDKINPETGRFKKGGEDSDYVLLSWDDMICSIVPALLKKESLSFWKGDVLSSLISHEAKDQIKKKHPNDRLSEIAVYRDDWNVILMQLRGLGILKLNNDGKWEVTAYGDNYYTKLIGVLKGEITSSHIV